MENSMDETAYRVRLDKIENDQWRDLRMGFLKSFLYWKEKLSLSKEEILLQEQLIFESKDADEFLSNLSRTFDFHKKQV